jgi:hypothetical protein
MQRAAIIGSRGLERNFGRERAYFVGHKRCSKQREIVSATRTFC